MRTHSRFAGQQITGIDNRVKRYFPHVGNGLGQTVGVAASLQKRLGKFLREKRGDLSLPAYARKLGISSSSLHRMEMGEQNVTLATLELILKRLKVSLWEIFEDGTRKPRPFKPAADNRAESPQR